MKNRLLSFLFVVCLTCGLCACGGDGGSTEDDGGINPESTPSSQGANEIGVTDSSETEGMNEATFPFPEDQTFPEYDGLIIERVYSRGDYNTGYHFTVDLTCLNIDIGTNQSVSAFEFDVGQKDIQAGYIMPASATLFGQLYNRGLFSEHYDKMALGRFSDDAGIVSAGWMDQNGNFFDVSGALGLEPEYGIGFEAVGFCGDYFVFGEYKNANTGTNYCYVPVSDLRKENIVAIEKGIVNNPYLALSGKFHVGDPSKITWVGQNLAFGDISNGRIAIGDENQMIEFKPTNADCRNGIGSPGETQLAYLQKNENNTYGLYITEIHNLSAVRQIEIMDGTEYPFSTWTGSDGTRTIAFGTGNPTSKEGLIGCYLIDWE